MSSRLLALALLPVLATATAVADPLAGNYILNASSSATTGIHVNNDATSLTGSLTINNLTVTSAQLFFLDYTNGDNFSLTQVGPTTIDSSEHLLQAQISNILNPSESFYFSVNDISSTGTFTLSCGVDCDDYVSSPRSYVEYVGNIAATPEPSTFALLGTGALGAFGAARRRFRA